MADDVGTDPGTVAGTFLDSGRETPPPAWPGRDALPQTPTRSCRRAADVYITPLSGCRQLECGSIQDRRTPTYPASPTPKRSATKSDRFIPDRSSGMSMVRRFELHQNVRNKRKAEDDGGEDATDSQAQLAQAFANNGCLAASSCTPKRLFAPETLMSPLNTRPRDALGGALLGGSPFAKQIQRVILNPPKPQRKLSKAAYKVLDAPGLRNDFYSHLVDWGPGFPTPKESFLAVGLRSTIHLWSAASARVIKLCDLAQSELVTSISWMERGTHLALGTECGSVQIWDVNNQRRVRTMGGHTMRAGCLAWNDSTLTSGSRDRTILQRDVREPRHFTAQLVRHGGEVCGLKRRGGTLASGGNDNQLMVWDERQALQPLWLTAAHRSAVRALDWSPHQAGILVSGGGINDRHLKIWNVQTGKLLASRHTNSQICDVAWSRNSNEIVSAQGFSSNQVVLWKASKLTQIATLTGHEDKVLYLSLSPDGETIATGSSDETLRFWKVFPAAAQPKRESSIAGTPTMVR